MVDEAQCPVRQGALMLRHACDGCQGRPRTGQRTLPPGSLLYIERDPAEAIYGLIEGFMRETRTLADGRTQGIRLVCPGELLGTEALAERPYQCTAEALTEVRVCRVEKAELAALHASHPEQGLELVAALGREAADLRDAVLLVGSMTAEERTKALLDRLLAAVPRGEWLRLPLSRAEIAELLGLAPETVSRFVHRLAREGHFEVRGRRVRVPPPEA